MPNFKQKLFSRRVDQKFLNDVSFSLKYTPDAAYLEQFERQLLFVADNWMTGHIDHDRICNQELVYPTAFTRDHYSMVYKPLGLESYPIILEIDKKKIDTKKWTDPNRPTVLTKQARVRGQVWAVIPSHFKNLLDKVRENGYAFTRKRVVIDIPLRRTQDGNSCFRVSDGDAEYFRTRLHHFTIPSGASLKLYPRRMWMYVGVPEYWEKMIKGKYELPFVRIMRPRTPLLSEYFYWLKEGSHNK